MAKRWRHKVGPHGATVTVYERKRGGSVYVKAYDSDLGGYRKRSLRFAARDVEGKLIEEKVEKAKKAAADLSNDILHGGGIPDRVTVKEAVRLFKREEVPDMSEKHAKSTERELALLETFLGPRFVLEDLGTREWNALRRQRASGEIDARGNRVADPERRRPVSARTTGKTLKVARQFCRLASRYRRPDGSFLLDRDPTAGLEVPTEKNPARPVCSDKRYKALLGVADDVHPYLRTMLVLAGETGRRIGAIRALRYSDWLPDLGSHGALRWRADSDKIGREWVAPINATAREEMKRVLRERPGVGEAFLFPDPDTEEHMDRDTVYRWWRRAEDLADLDHPEGGGWHSLRRRWATKRKKGLPLKDVAYVGGWQGTEVLTQVYQAQDWQSMEEVASGGRDLREAK